MKVTFLFSLSSYLIRFLAFCGSPIWYILFVQFLRGIPVSTFVKLILIGGLLGGSVAAVSAQARKNKPAPTQTKSAQETAFALFESGQDAHANGKLEEAVKLYSQALTTDETLWQAQMQLTSAYYSLNRLPEARTSINKVLAQLKEFPESHELKQTAYKRLAVETALSKEVLQKGGKKEAEIHILEVWGKYYEDAIGKMKNVQVGGNSEKVTKAIIDAQNEVKQKTQQIIYDL